MKSEKMRIIQVIPMFGLAGAESMCENLSIELVNKGYDVRVISLYNYHSAITERLENCKIPVIYLNKKKGLDASIVFKLIHVFAQVKPDVVHTHLYALKYAAFASIVTRVKVRIHTMHNIAEKESSPKDQILNNFFFKHCKVVPVSLSDEIRNTVMKRYGLTENQTPVIYNGVDLNKCIPKVHSSSKGLHYLHIGRFTKQKNHKMLIEAFNKVHNIDPNTDLTLIGSGELENNIKEQVISLGLESAVHFLGTRNNVYPYLNAADAFVMSSIYEGMPMTIIEAMGTGLPIISTDVGGIRTLIEPEKEGILIDSSSEALANAMLRMKDYRLRTVMGNNAQEKARKFFSALRMTDSYVEQYERLR